MTLNSTLYPHLLRKTPNMTEKLLTWTYSISTNKMHMALMNLIFMAEVILSRYMQLRNQKLHLRMTITINKVNVQRYQMLVSDKRLLETVQTLISSFRSSLIWVRTVSYPGSYFVNLKLDNMLFIHILG